MRSLLKIILTITLLSGSLTICAKKKHAESAGDIQRGEVTLIVSSDGNSKDEAISNALRSAIEQTYGAFVSANTEILNDEIVKDEIATVASGNIKSYKVISENVMSPSQVNVTLEAVVSVNKLVSYAKSKGAECELDGSSLAHNIELEIFYRDNEEKAIQNLLSTTKTLLKNAFDYKIDLEKISYSKEEESWAHGYNLPQPRLDYSDSEVSIPIKVSAVLNKFGEKLFKNLFDQMNALAIKEKEINLDELKKSTEKIFKGMKTPDLQELILAFNSENIDEIINIAKKAKGKKTSDLEKFEEALRKVFDYSEEPTKGSILVINTPGAHSDIEVHRTHFKFRSSNSVRLLESFFSHDINNIIKDYRIIIEDSSIASHNPDARQLHSETFAIPFTGQRHSETLDVIILTADCYFPNIKEGQGFYLYTSSLNLPIDKVKQVKNIKILHN